MNVCRMKVTKRLIDRDQYWPELVHWKAVHSEINGKEMKECCEEISKGSYSLQDTTHWNIKTFS